MKSDFEWEILPEYEFKNWDSWVLSRSNGSWFHTIRAFEIVYEKKPEILVIKDENQNWIAGFSFIRAKKYGLNYPKRNPFLYFSSPVISDDYLDNFNGILQKLKSHFSFLILNFTYLKTEYPNLSNDLIPQYGWWLPIEKTELLQLERCESNHKRHLKKELLGKIDFILPNELTEKEIGLVNQSYQDHDKESPYRTEKLLEVFSRLKKNEAIIARYKFEDITIGWRCWLIDPRGFWIDWMSGLNRTESTESFGQHLCFESFTKAREMGAVGIDFGGANTSGISEFKKRFGCEQRFGGLITLTRNSMIRKILELKDGRK